MMKVTAEDLLLVEKALDDISKLDTRLRSHRPTSKRQEQVQQCADDAEVYLRSLVEWLYDEVSAQEREKFENLKKEASDGL
jgi:hypothetical protein